jgi:hypothetical protein
LDNNNDTLYSLNIEIWKLFIDIQLSLDYVYVWIYVFGMFTSLFHHHFLNVFDDLVLVIGHIWLYLESYFDEFAWQ